MRKTLLTGLLASATLSGCVAQTGYGDGRLVRVDTDSSFSDEEKELVGKAAHVWDVFGAR